MVSETENEGAKCYIIFGETYSLCEAISTSVKLSEFCTFDSEDGATQRESQSSGQGCNSEFEMVDDSWSLRSR
jgi:hypothetical protein